RHGAAYDRPSCVADAKFVQGIAREAVLIVRCKRPSGCVLRTDRHAAGNNGPAPVGKGGHRRGVFTEVRQSSKGLIPAPREPVIDPYIALILILDLVGRAAVVVGGGTVSRERVAVEKRQRHRIHRTCRNRVVGELLTCSSDSRSGIVNVLPEDSRTLGECWH